MIIVLKPEATKKDADEILEQITVLGLKPLYLPGSERVVIGALGDERVLQKLHFDSHPMVERATPILTLYKQVSRDFHGADTVVTIGSNARFGGKHFSIIAGPCAIESREQFQTVAESIRTTGATCLRGGAFKPRSSPYSFQGLGLEGLRILKEVCLRTGLPAVTEVLEVADIEAVAEYADAFQVGARNMQNYRMLQELGHQRKPVVLKRGMAATVEELLLAAEYIVNEGNPNVILCERGIRTFETATRNTLDLNAVAYIKKHSHLPVIVDPSHGTGVRDFILPLSRAAIACGSDGLMIEVHPDPKCALSDGHQSLDIAQFQHLVREITPLLSLMGKTI
ncbi:MAG: 3-deoxy-7-phosphoheptulonate synthase [Chitinivibrionales bacterium]|nr:3-deoxy-7-phosphoheptulonate synthase [Chitinivibrionales bacterium]